MKNFIQRLIPLDDLKTSIIRFPLSILCALSMFIIGVLMVHDLIDQDEENIGRLLAILGCCYFWFGITNLIAESRGWGFIKQMILALPVVVGMAALFLISSVWGLHLLFVLPALLLLVMVAPYIAGGGDDLSFWFYNRIVLFGAIVSYAALIMFAGGLSVALIAIHELFDVEIAGEIYADIWMFAALVLGPVYALSWVPKHFEFTDDDCRDPPGLKFIVNWISMPMVMIYMLILYAYFVRIIMLGEVPNGLLAYLISGFAGAGIVTYLAAWPLQKDGSPQLRLFYKVFFPALLIPVGFHFYAIFERISAYGITEQRYLLIISALWFALVAMTNAFQKIPIKAIPMTLAILFVFASFGPWGGVSVSGHSQFSRLEKLLTKYEILVDDKIVKTEKEIPFNDRRSISSILEYLCGSERDAMLAPWFAEESIKDHDSWSCSSRHILTKSMGFEYVGRYNNNHDDGRFRLEGDKDIPVKIAGYDFILTNQYTYLSNNKNLDLDNRELVKCDLEDKREMLVVLDEHGNMFIKIENKIVLEYNLYNFVSKKLEHKNNSGPLYIEAQSEHIAIRLNFSYIAGKANDEVVEIQNLSFDLLFSLKDK